MYGVLGWGYYLLEPPLCTVQYMHPELGCLCLLHSLYCQRVVQSNHPVQSMYKKHNIHIIDNNATYLIYRYKRKRNIIYMYNINTTEYMVY